MAPFAPSDPSPFDKGRAQVTPPDAPVRFSARLREATKEVHREAERTGFIADLIRGRASEAGYALFLRNLVPVYAALEARLQTCAGRDNPLLARFAAPELRRLSRLTADLEAIAGEGWQDALPVVSDAEAYARAIEAAVIGNGSRLVAHAYARYLGDLSGGQILKPLLARKLSLPLTALSFYDFPDVIDIEAAKDSLRDSLDTLDPAGADADAIVDEALLAFRLNIDLSQAVSDALAASIS